MKREKLTKAFEQFYVIKTGETLKVTPEGLTRYPFERGLCGCPGCVRHGHCKHLRMRDHSYIGNGCPANEFAEKFQAVGKTLGVTFDLGDWGERQIVRIDRAKKLEEFVVVLFEGVALYLPEEL